MNLQILRSIISPVTLQDLIKNNYSFDEECLINILNIGDNDHYLVQFSKVAYVLRIYRYNKHWLQKEAHYLFEIDLLLFLKENGIPVSYPIPMKDHSYLGNIQAPEGIRRWALFSLASGNEMPLEEESFYQYGAIISKFHCVSNNFQPQHERIALDESFLIDLPVERINDALYHSHKNDVDNLNILAKNLKSRINDFNIKHSNNDKWGIIGGDFHGGNHLHALNTKKITLFDFDLCGYGWRIYDIAVFRWELFICNTIHKIPQRLALWQAFLDGYITNRFLSEDEIKMIQAFVQIRQIWIIGSKLTYPDVKSNKYYLDKIFSRLKLAQEGDYV